jgi:hypothetical protein
VNRSSAGLFEKVIDQTKHLFWITVYFWVLIELFTVFKSLVLSDTNIVYHHGFAIINAFVLAKVVLVAEFFYLAENLKTKPLIYPIVFKSAVFCVLLMSFHVVEEVLVGIWHGKTIAESFSEIGGGSWRGMFVVAVILFVGLVPFFSYRELARVLGKDELHSLILKRGTLAEPT